VTSLARGWRPGTPTPTRFAATPTSTARCSKRRTPDHVLFAGDSAGGGLALAFAQSLATLDLPQPVKLVFFAPWLDITLANPAIPDVERHDPWLSSAGLGVAGRTWAGTTDLDDPEGRRDKDRVIDDLRRTFATVVGDRRRKEREEFVIDARTSCDGGCGVGGVWVEPGRGWS
jgi:acetyl esterase/lipase